MGTMFGESTEEEEMGWEWLISSDILANLPISNKRVSPLGVVPSKL